MQNLKAVLALRDDAGHWYVIPKELREEWNRITDYSYQSDNWDEFEEKFGNYRTGGDLNNTQLYAEL